jgi:hypothetical protein
MAIDCGKLAMGVIGKDCDNPLVMGLKGEVVLFNQSDIDLTETTVEDGIITNLVLKTGTKAYKAEMLDKTTTANIALAKGAYSNGWDQNVTLRVLDIAPEVKKFIEQLSDSKVVAVVQNNYAKLNSATEKGITVYEAYGFYTGLELNENTRDTEDADTKGGYVITLGCNDNVKEPTLPVTIFNTDLETTQTMIDGLTV